MKKTTLMDRRVKKPANKSGPQQPLVPGSSHASGSAGKKTGPRGR